MAEKLIEDQAYEFGHIRITPVTKNGIEMIKVSITNNDEILVMPKSDNSLVIKSESL